MSTQTAPPEPPVGTWMRDRHGALTYRQPNGWGQPGTVPAAKWEAMWAARGPLIPCGPWGSDLTEVEATLRATSGEALLRAYAALTHRGDRDQRDLIKAELLRRLGEGS